ncbi:MAG TPA: tRNA uridine-5-carboxymethylaminomethyl(34) synthesis GTPase MnmE [Clostridiaceae bacterium]|jgi:tRNA modification GTPase|nr:tRNA uridine-5-carboxymethylaminomethyl(34) synthesis GTPase MnmE [Clostridiaceae bacterium]
MINMDMDTIAAFSTPPGESGLAVLRISGSHAASICDRLFVPSSSRFAKPSAMVGYTLAHGYWGKIDEVVLACFRAPHSYTGEDVYEISCHGGQAIRQAVLDSVLAAGARPAGPGEFSRRAFFNGKMDLTAAEAVMDMIGAQAEKQAQAAYRQLTGGVSRVIHERTDHLYGALARLEMLLDWDEEEERPEDRELLVCELEYAERELRLLADSFAGGRIIREGLAVVIAGSPNVGKSTLLNALSGRDRAIVSNIPGTTRDTVEVDLTLDGYLVHLTDTAGLAIDSDDPIEREGIVRAENALRTADLILWVLSPPLPPEDERREEEVRIDRCLAEGKEILFVLGKDDLRLTLSAEKDPAHYAVERYPDLPSMTWSDRSEDDLQRLKETLVRFIESGSLMSPVEGSEIAAHDQVKSHGEGQSHGLLTHARHKTAVDRAVELVKKARADLQAGLSFDLVAISLKEALTELSTITGEDVSETLIDKIFSRFCIGK